MVKRAKDLGRETALRDKLPFEEALILEENQYFIFENMKKVKNIQVLAKDDPKVASLQGAEMIA